MSYYIHPLQQHDTYHINHKRLSKKNNKNFVELFKKEQQLKISKHAKQRLSERNIKINDDKWQKISDKMNEANKKGVTDAVVVTDDAALIVSNKNKTVVTALAYDEADEKIFTNINGMILIK